MTVEIPTGHSDHEHYMCLTCGELQCSDRRLERHMEYHHVSVVPEEARR